MAKLVRSRISFPLSSSVQSGGRRLGPAVLLEFFWKHCEPVSMQRQSICSQHVGCICSLTGVALLEVAPSTSTTPHHTQLLHRTTMPIFVLTISFLPNMCVGAITFQSCFFFSHCGPHYRQNWYTFIWLLNKPFSEIWHCKELFRVCMYIYKKDKFFLLHYLRIRQEWDIVLECRKKGLPQNVYLNNGFIDTNRILDKLENNSSLIKKIALLNETEKERNKFIFHLSGDHWTVSFHQVLCLDNRLFEWYSHSNKPTLQLMLIILLRKRNVVQSHPKDPLGRHMSAASVHCIGAISTVGAGPMQAVA